jgi:autotransporter-associated beta strand protein
VANKTYDGDTSVTIDVSAATFTGLVAGDDVTVSATGVFSDKNVDTGKTITLTETNGGDDVGNYTITAQGTTTANITAKALTATITAQDKVYDASNQAIVSLALSGYVGDETLVTTETTARFDNINVGERTATVTAITLGDGTNGGLVSNYSLATGQTDTANITPALLTITAANAAKFVTDNDPEFTVIYNGFVGSEDSSDLTTIGTVARTDANTAAGTYEGVIAPSGYAAGNYTFKYVNGDLTIVPSDGLIIDINLAENNISYGSTISYESVQATYWDENTNQSRNVDNTSVDVSSVVVNHDGTQVSFVIAPVSSETDCSLGGCYSSSNRLNTGGYNLGAENNEVTVNDDSTIAIIGSLNVLRKVIDPDDLSISEVSKVYDGSTEISSVTASYIQDNKVVFEGDDLQITASGSYSSRHVGTNKPININLTLSGDDSNNYAFEVDDVNGANLSLNSGTITQLDSVTWAGDAEGGLWSAADSWLNGAIPDNDNVALVTIPDSYSTTLDADSFGTFSAAIVNSGTIILNNANEYELSNTMSGAGTIRFSGDGAITLSGNNSHTGITDITDSSLTISHANALGSSTLASSEGSLSISSGLTLDSLTTTGALKLLTDVNTTNDQTYGGNVEVLAGTAADPLEINSTTGDITFNGTLTAGSGSKAATRSLQINGNYKEGDDYTNAGNVTFNDRVGYAFNGQIFTNLTGTNFYNFDITGNSININADIMTFNAQEYTGPVLIGDNGSNGLTRRLVSIDPSVTFNHSVNDSDGTHTLIVEAYALSASDPAPTITANGEIGDQTAFANPVQFITGVHDNTLNNPDNIWGNSNSLTDHVGQSINIRGVVSNSRGVNFNNFAANNAAAAAPVNNGSSAASNNGFTGGNQFGIVQQLLNQIRQNSQLIRAATNTKPVVEVGVILENCEAISDDSECLAQ